MAAFLVPIHLFLYGIAVPLGWVSADVAGYARMRALFGHPLVKIYLFVLIALPLYHWAHRFPVEVSGSRGGVQAIAAGTCSGGRPPGMDPYRT